MVLGLFRETNYLKKLSFGQNQGIAWSLDSNLWGNQLLKKAKFWIESRYCSVLPLKEDSRLLGPTRGLFAKSRVKS